MSYFNLLISFLLALVAQGLDVYFVRHGARAPLQAQMQEIFGADPEDLTDPGRSQSYYLGQEIRGRHPYLSSDKLSIFSTDTNRTKMTAQYFLKGWHGMRQKGDKWIQMSPYYVPPYRLCFRPQYKYFFTNQTQYKKEVFQIPMFQDKTGRDYKQANYTDRNGEQNLIKRIRQNQQICKKFEKFSKGSCNGSNPNTFFLLKDITKCLDFINVTVPDITLKQLDILTDVVNFDYNYQFRQLPFPTPGVQQDFYLLQKFYELSPHNVVVQFTHDTMLFHTLRSLLGLEGTFSLFKNKFQMDFLSTLHYNLQNGIARIYFNDKQIYLPKCKNKRCTIQQLFKIMNQ